MLWYFLVSEFAFYMWRGRFLVGNCTDYAPKEVVELSRHDAGGFSEGWKCVTHLADEPKTEVNDETF